MSVQDISFVPTTWDVAYTQLKKTSDQVISSTTLTNITGLSFPLSQVGYYFIDIFLVFQSDAINTGIKIALTFPDGTVEPFNISIPQSGDDELSRFVGNISATGQSVTSTGVPVVNTDFIAHIRGSIVPNTSGTFQVQAALEQGTTNIILRKASAGIIYNYWR